MTTKSVGDLAKDRMETGYRSLQLAKLVKLLDMEQATLLISAYQNFPEEVARDLEMMEVALCKDDHCVIREILGWYDLRNWTAANGDSTESIEKDRANLRICERSA